MAVLTHAGSGPAASVAGRIGPNAIIRAAEALRAQVGEGRTAEVFRAAGLGGYLLEPPVEMVDEREVTQLYRVLRAELGASPAREISLAAGARTGDYLLAHRIPPLAQRLLRVLPPALASRALLAAIARNAWTFAGSGAFEFRAGNPSRMSLTGCPLCRGANAVAPLCDYYAATFERLFRKLVSSRATVREAECQAAGAGACVFEARW
jgi:divinyl protochlorophyllide a 8-vinyl-reductase